MKPLQKETKLKSRKYSSSNNDNDSKNNNNNCDSVDRFNVFEIK